MRQFQGSLGPFTEFEHKGTPGPAEPLKNASAGASRSVKSKPHASRDDCVCRACRKARILEQRSMEPLSFWEKVQVYGALSLGTALFAGWVAYRVLG